MSRVGFCWRCGLRVGCRSLGWEVSMVDVGEGRHGNLLELWNSRSSWRSVWPRSPFGGG